MEFLKEIASDYAKVKAGVYERYSGIGSLGRLSSVYDIMTEMRRCGLREQLELPSVYYELAVRDAISDIKGMWGMVKNKIRTLVTANENLSGDDRMYLRTVLKLDKVYAAILNQEDYTMPEKAAGLNLDRDRLNRLLRRLTRKYLMKPTAGRADSFCVSPGGYSYKENALYLVSRIPRRRVMLPLKDHKTSARQIRVCIKNDHAEIAIPAEVKKRKHGDYKNTIYIKCIPLETIYKCGVFGLPLETEPYRPFRWEEYPALDEIVPGKAVIFAPYAKSVTTFDEAFWKPIVTDFRERGYQCFTNVVENEKPLAGTRGISPGIAQMKSVVQRAGNFIGIRSGLCDVIRYARCKKIALYPDYNYSDTKWKAIDMYAIDGWENIVVDGDFAWDRI